MVKNIWMYMEKRMAVIELKKPVADKFAGSEIKVRINSHLGILCKQ